MTKIDDELLTNTPGQQDISDARLITQYFPEQLLPLSAAPAPDQGSLKVSDFSHLNENPDKLRPTLAKLIGLRAHRFDPVRFRYIETLVDKACRQRPSVARMIEQKALQALSDYIADYLPVRNHTASLLAQVSSESPEVSETMNKLFDEGDLKGVKRLTDEISRNNNKQRVLAELTREMLKHDQAGEFCEQLTFEDELRQQELDVMQLIAGVASDIDGEAGKILNHKGAGEAAAMRNFRQSLDKSNLERVIMRLIQEGPENPGPLNQQALIIRSLSAMKAISPGYISRFVSYMDTLLWLEQASEAAAPKKSKSTKGRRKS